MSFGPYAYSNDGLAFRAVAADYVAQDGEVVFQDIPTAAELSDAFSGYSEAVAAQESKVAAKAATLANLKTVLADYVAKLNVAYPGLNLDVETDTLETATVKILSTDIAATECAALDMIYRQIQRNS